MSEGFRIIAGAKSEERFFRKFTKLQGQFLNKEGMEEISAGIVRVR